MAGKTISLRLRSRRDADLIKIFDSIEPGDVSTFIRRCIRFFVRENKIPPSGLLEADLPGIPSELPAKTIQQPMYHNVLLKEQPQRAEEKPPGKLKWSFPT